MKVEGQFMTEDEFDRLRFLPLWTAKQTRQFLKLSRRKLRRAEGLMPIIDGLYVQADVLRWKINEPQ